MLICDKFLSGLSTFVFKLSRIMSQIVLHSFDEFAIAGDNDNPSIKEMSMAWEGLILLSLSIINNFDDSILFCNDIVTTGRIFLAFA